MIVLVVVIVLLLIILVLVLVVLAIRIMTQDESDMSRALLAITRRLGLMRGKIAPHKQLVDSGLLTVTSTSTPKITSSTRDILTSYPFTKVNRKSLSFTKKLVNSDRLQRTHKLSTTIL